MAAQNRSSNNGAAGTGAGPAKGANRGTRPSDQAVQETSLAPDAQPSAVVLERLSPADSSPGSGAATPRPDPSDKRLPGIKQSHLGQVGRPSASVHVLSPPFVPILEDSPNPLPGAPSSSLEARATGLVTDVLTAPSSPRLPDSADDEDQGEEDGPPLLSHELVEKAAPADGRAAHGVDMLPTPPDSLAPSLYRERCSGSEVDHLPNSVPSSRAPSPRPSDELARPMLPLRTRRRTLFLSNPLSSIITMSNVHAAYFSSPVTPSAETAPTSPFATHAYASPGSQAPSSYFELKRLTEGRLTTSRVKNTPPHTPRTSSNEATPTREQKGTQVSKLGGKDAATRRRTEGQSRPGGSGTLTPARSATPNGETIGRPKGKLSVKISRARGLRPSHDPYVVCVFEWNEYISKGPKSGGVDPSAMPGLDDRFGGVPIRRSASDMGRGMAIPMKSRQGSHTSLSESRELDESRTITEPRWDHEAVFDVTGDKSDVDISVYDRSEQETFLGHVRLSPNLNEKGSITDGWFKLEPRGAGEEPVSGEIQVRLQYQKTDKKHYGPEDFQILKLIGKGTFGQVYQVRKKDTQRIYAMKVLSKKVIVQKKEVAHTVGERNILVRTAMSDSPFIVGLKFSFQTPTDLYLVTDFMSGGELFWHLQKEGRFNEHRAKFYIAELILALQHLHKHDIVYRDLKPENILLDANGHVALCDFGLSKANLTKNDTTNTFCGTTEYLAPEVLLDDAGYTKMVDFWSLGVLIFEMCCGWSPFYADDTQQMYKNIAFGKVRFPRDALSTEGRNFVKGLLNRNPKHRLGATNDAEELKVHPFFDDIDWDALMKKNVVPPFKPKLKSVLDTSNFDPEFTNALNGSSSLNHRAAALASGAMPASTPLSPGVQANFRGFTFVDESSMEDAFGHHDQQSLERMDEDDEDEREYDEDGWAGSKGQRMSGIVRTGGADDGVFNDVNFDV